MRNVAYIGAGGTLFAFIITGFVQFIPAADDAVKFLSWTVPSVITLLSWGIQIFLTWKKVRRSLIADVTKELKHDLDEMENRLVEKSVAALWLRIPTIIQLSKTPDEGPEDHKETKRKP